MTRKEEQGRAVDATCVIKYLPTTDDHWCVHHAQYVMTCEVCDADFHSDRPHTLTCSNRCRMKRSRGNQLPMFSSEDIEDTRPSADYTNMLD